LKKEGGEKGGLNLAASRRKEKKKGRKVSQKGQAQISFGGEMGCHSQSIGEKKG